jgi:hypothetical protein
MRELIVEKFDGAEMSVIVGERLTLNELKALQLVADIDRRNAEYAAKKVRAEAVKFEFDKLTADLTIDEPTLTDETAEAKFLIKNFVRLCKENARAVPAVLTAFIAGDEQPADNAPENAAPNAPTFSPQDDEE